MSEYNVQYCGKQVGTIVAKQEGLYIRFVGQLKLPEGYIYRLCVQMDEQCIDLGVLIMDGCNFKISTRIPLKRIGRGEPVFCITETDDKPAHFFEIREDRAFPYIPLLPNGILKHDFDKLGILVSDDHESTVAVSQ